MTTISNIAQRILDENNWTTSDISTTNLEYRIDDAIDYINLKTGLAIADLSGTAGSKSLTGTDSQIFCIKWLTNMFIRAYKEKGPNVSIGGLSVTAITNDPDFTATMKLVDSAIERLKEPPIFLSEDEVPTE